jgi:F-type H+-transporting ATPase subunit c
MSKTRALFALVVLIGGLGLLGVDTALAEGEDAAQGAAAQPAAPVIPGLALLGGGLVILGAGAGIGRIGQSTVEWIARQPEAAGAMFTPMIITAAMIEGAAFFAIIAIFVKG